MSTKQITIHEQLNPILETAGLLFILGKKDTYKQEWIAEHNELGLNGEMIYEKHLHYIESYVEQFTKHAIISETGMQLLKDTEGKAERFWYILIFMVHYNRHWLNQFEAISSDEILHEVLSLLVNLTDHESKDQKLEDIKSTEQFIDFLDECECTESDKWKLLQLYFQPKKIFGEWIALINTNVQAYEKALSAVESTYLKLIEGYKISVPAQKLNAYKNLVEGVDESLDVYPSLIFPDSLGLFKQTIFYGLILDKIPLAGDDPDDLKAYLTLRLKALADPSKLGIMKLLQQGEKYNLEIAELLGVTAATTSHHMNVLLATGLVGIEKKQGKVYYHLEPEGISQLVQKLEQYLL